MYLILLLYLYVKISFIIRIIRTFYRHICFIGFIVSFSIEALFSRVFDFLFYFRHVCFCYFLIGTIFARIFILFSLRLFSSCQESYHFQSELYFRAFLIFFFTFETKCCCYVYLILLLNLYVNISCSLLLHHCKNQFNYHTLIKNIFLINIFGGCVVLSISIFNATTFSNMSSIFHAVLIFYFTFDVSVFTIFKLELFSCVLLFCFRRVWFYRIIFNWSFIFAQF